MLSPVLSRKVRSPHRSPPLASFTGPTATTLSARRGSIEERRRTAGRHERVPSISFQQNKQESSDDEANHIDDNANGRSEILDDDDDHQSGELSPLLPIFSAEHLDSLPVYSITLLIRALICNRCETTLTWDQLRTPQVSQFLIKPIQKQIKEAHFSKATLYALLANCLQFCKEVHTNLGSSGVSRTRAFVSELLAIRLLKEFSTRELIDALAYDFYPLQGLTTRNDPPGPNWNQRPRSMGRVARVSTFEIAIRAQAKRFLAHPLVIEQLEAIWKGNVVFHHAADGFHRYPVKIVPNQNRGYGAIGSSNPPILRASPDRLQPAKQREHRSPIEIAVRRSVTLYDPRQASLLKLSRLRVPRYRQFLSTCSFAVLLALYLAVLYERSLCISALEIIFWLWSAGFLLDEIVGFNEQGFSLYIMSFWNAFDVGILCLLIFYYFLRIYGMTLPSEDEQKSVASTAYDLLAANAVLLFPRLFSVLDHYRYFSQLLIAFRMMAMDLIAVFILVVVSCSGFFVAFTLSFGKAHDYDAGSVAFSLFQILMGFTPAAWDSWSDYNLLGRAILTLFLFICHFLIVTILITVLTNSFMSIVQNANEEHQFVFAVNTISMVKSDALFSYVAPANILSWCLAPLRFFLTFRAFVRLNRSAIKATHFPILFGIYLYERIFLGQSIFGGTELIENRGRSKFEGSAPESRLNGLNIFSVRSKQARDPSIATFHQDRALEQVFRGPLPAENVSDTPRHHRRRQTSNAVSHWMTGMGPEGLTQPPMEQDQSILDRLESRQPLHRRSIIALRKRQGGSTRDFTEATMSVASDPEDFSARKTVRAPYSNRRTLPFATPEKEEPPIQAADTADDELASDTDDDLLTLDQQYTNDQDQINAEPVSDIGHRLLSAKARQATKESPKRNLAHTFSSSSSLSSTNKKVSLASTPRLMQIKKSGTRRHHERNASINTIIYDPQAQRSSAAGSLPKQASPRKSTKVDPKSSRNSSGRQTPKRAPKAIARPIMPPRTAFKSAPDLAGMLTFATNTRHGRRTSLTSFDIGSDIGDNKAIGGGFADALMPASFTTQLNYANAGMRARKAALEHEKQESNDRMNRLVLARMSTLEEGLREMIKEVQGIKRGGISQYYDSESTGRATAERPNVGKRADKGEENPDADRLAFDMETEEARD